MNHVVFFGAYDRSYPRNRILRAGLAAASVEVREAHTRQTFVPFQMAALAHAFARVRDGASTIVVPEFRHKDMRLARALARGRPLVFDPLVSRHDTLVHDWGIHPPGSLQARWNRRIDRLALAAADVVICDTWAHGALYEALGVPRARLRRVLVGAEDPFFGIAPPPPAPPVRILYAGGFLPLHGVSTMLEAAARLERRGQSGYEMVLIGRGITHDADRRRAAALGLTQVRFEGPRPYDELPAALAAAHIVLGAFGTSDKAGRVIPHKVYQGLAAGRAVVTGDGEGPRELLQDAVHARLVPRGNAEALADVLGALMDDPEARAALGARGATRAREVATVERIGASMAAAIAEVA